MTRAKAFRKLLVAGGYPPQSVRALSTLLPKLVNNLEKAVTDEELAEINGILIDPHAKEIIRFAMLEIAHFIEKHYDVPPIKPENN